MTVKPKKKIIKKKKTVTSSNAPSTNDSRFDFSDKRFKSVREKSAKIKVDSRFSKIEASTSSPSFIDSDIKILFEISRVAPLSIFTKNKSLLLFLGYIDNILFFFFNIKSHKRLNLFNYFRINIGVI